MYGTVARLRVKPGAEDAFARVSEQYTTTDIPPGMIAELVYRTDADPQGYILAVVFASKEDYWANANSPEQHARYEQLRQLLAADPEWSDGEVVHHFPPARP